MCNTDKSKGVYPAGVVVNKPLCDEHFLITLAVENFPQTQAGQFVQLQCAKPGPVTGSRVVDWDDNPDTPKPPVFELPELTENQRLLRRPLSLADARVNGETTELDIIYRVVGAGTNWLSQVKPGDEISVLGPLGTEFPIYPKKKFACLVGGGVGIPPMLYLAKALSEAGITPIAFCGVRSRNLLPLSLTAEPDQAGNPANCTAEFTARGAQTVITSDDGSVGFGGLVIEPLRNWLETSGVNPDDVALYSCGPERMMQAVGEIAIEIGCACDLSLERSMACGMGTCQSCIVKIKDSSEQGWAYKRCCTEGPVFPARSIIWE